MFTISDNKLPVSSVLTSIDRQYNRIAEDVVIKHVVDHLPGGTQ